MGWMILIIYLAQMGGWSISWRAGFSCQSTVSTYRDVDDGLQSGHPVDLKHMPIAYKVFLAASLGAVLYVQFVLSLTWIAGWLPALVGVFVLLLF